MEEEEEGLFKKKNKKLEEIELESGDFESLVEVRDV